MPSIASRGTASRNAFVRAIRSCRSAKLVSSSTNATFSTPPIRTAVNFAVSLARCTCPASVSIPATSRACNSASSAIPSASANARPFSSTAASRSSPRSSTGTVIS